MQAADGVDIATVLATDEDFELRIDGAGVSDESADHLLDCRVDGDERMTLEEFLVDVERQEAVGVVAGNGECRLGEVVGTEGSEAIGGVAIVVVAGFFAREFGDDFAGGDGGSACFDHRAECVRNCEALVFLDLGGNLDGDFENGLDFGGDNHERDFNFGFRMFAFLNEFGGGIQNGLDLHLGDFGVGDGHTNRAVAEHRVLFLFQAAVVQEELMERRVEQYVRILSTIHEYSCKGLQASNKALFLPTLILSIRTVTSISPLVPSKKASQSFKMISSSLSSVPL